MGDNSRRAGTGTGTDGTRRAFVHTRWREIGYTRSGRGAPVLLLAAHDPTRERLRAAFARHFTVIAPGLTESGYSTNGLFWLPVFLDSLGLDRPHLVVTDPHGLAALHFALSDPDRVDRIAMLWQDEVAVEVANREDSLEDRLRISGHPLLLLALPPEREDIASPGADRLGTAIRFLCAYADDRMRR